jgi:hypothetical protein
LEETNSGPGSADGASNECSVAEDARGEFIESEDRRVVEGTVFWEGES